MRYREQESAECSALNKISTLQPIFPILKDHQDLYECEGVDDSTDTVSYGHRRVAVHMNIVTAYTRPVQAQAKPNASILRVRQEFSPTDEELLANDSCWDRER